MARGLPDYGRSGLGYADWITAAGLGIDRESEKQGVSAGVEVGDTKPNLTGKRWLIYQAYCCSPIDETYNRAQPFTFKIESTTEDVIGARQAKGANDSVYLTFPKGLVVEPGDSIRMYVANLGAGLGDFAMGWSGIQEP